MIREPIAAAAGMPARTLWLDADGALLTLDQTLLPFERCAIRLASLSDCAHAIRSMQVRGAPLIGAVAAWGLVFGLRVDASDTALDSHFDTLAATRPTAVNLAWALKRCRDAVAPLPVAERAAAAAAVAQAICDEDAENNRRIGEHGVELLRALVQPGRPLQVLTHCNAGALATLAWGTALAPLYLLHEAGVPLHVWVDETRPRNQGVLTAWELAQRGVPHTVVVDNAGGMLMHNGRVDAVIVGCDRVAANGDVANKIGTYLKALAAKDNDVPFWVACPIATIDGACPDGGSIPIEERAGDEVRFVRGRLAAGATSGSVATGLVAGNADGGGDHRDVVAVDVLPPESAVANPAFDVTPARLVSGLITELGVFEASPEGVASALAAAARSASAGAGAGA